MPDPAELGQRLRGMGRVLLGYSGGVDSALLAVIGRRWVGRDRFTAALGRSPSYPAAQRVAALDLVHRFDIRLHELDTHELDDSRYARNPTNRCYFCKAELWTRLAALARREGFDTIIDGTNADDTREHRPGLRAGVELGVRSPLAEEGWSKTDVRTAARGLGIPAWDAPASPCLSSRIRYGLAVTPSRLRQVEAGEAFLRRLGVTGDLRLRHHGTVARLEVEPAAFGLVDRRWDEITRFLTGLGFEQVERDPRGYRRGALLALAVP